MFTYVAPISPRLNRYDNVNSGNHAGVTTHMFYKWCEQVASGMEYLAQKQVEKESRLC